MKVQLELLESLHANAITNANNEIGILQFKSRIIQICSILASYSFYCEEKFILLQLKSMLNEISLISNKASKFPIVNKEHLQKVIVCLEMIIMLVKENEAIINRNSVTFYSEL